MNSYHIGIDLGGTKIESIILDTNFNELYRERISTDAHKGKDHILNQIHVIYKNASQKIKNSNHTIGIATPGSLSAKTNLLRNSNTACLNGLPIKDLIESKINRRVLIENDANCFALAEALLGAGKDYKYVFGVIMGTGCGGGFVIDKKIRSGINSISGEWGHSIINPEGPLCYCKKKGCVETYISGSGLEKFIESDINQKMTAEEFLNKTNFNNNELKVLNRFYHYFGLSLSNIINITDPDIVVLGGGLSNHNSLYTKGFEEIKRNIFSDYLKTPIVKNKLGDSAGVFGAAILGVNC